MRRGSAKDVARSDWEDAARGLFDFAVVTGRSGEDWRRDARAVMILEGVDPRGWLQYNGAPSPDPSTWCDVTRPFLPPHLSSFDTDVFEVSRASAVQQIVVLQGEWFTVATIPDFAERKEALCAQAETVLSRFGPDAAFYTNSGAALDDPDVDFFTADTYYQCFSDFLFDCGVIAVSPDEVGVFWRFHVE